MLENLLVCLRHCYDELRKVKGRQAGSVLRLHQFQYMILAQALHYFHEDAQDGGGLAGSMGDHLTTSYIPTLSSSAAQPPGMDGIAVCDSIVLAMARSMLCCTVANKYAVLDC